MAKKRIGLEEMGGKNGMNCCISDLQDKEVINVCNAARLGYVCDVEADACTGRITAVLVPGSGKLSFLHPRSRIRIPWDKITRVGEDLILVTLTTAELAAVPSQRRHFWEW